MNEIDLKLDRRGFFSIKWEQMAMAGGKNEDLPFWIADMDFPVEKKVTETLKKRTEHPVYGYTFVPDAYKEAICDWYNQKYETGLNKENIVTASGVLSAMVLIMKKLIQPGDSAFVFTPVYPQFYEVIRKAGAKMVSDVLMPGVEPDWEKIDHKLSSCKVLLFCNPHNPVARVWTDDACRKIAEICKKHDVLILSDDVHGDMALFGNRYHCLLSYEDARDRTIVFTSAAKTFNLAGLGGANLLIADEKLRKEVSLELSENFQNEISLFAVEGMMAAYMYGGPWLDETKRRIENNALGLIDFIKRKMPKITCRNYEGTFLMWLDIRGMAPFTENYIETLEKEQNVLVDNGKRYGKGGEGFIRMNIACQEEMLAEGLRRMEEHYHRYC